MVYKVYTTETFEKEISRLPKSEVKKIKRIYAQLKKNPYVGDIIRYYFFREKRLEEKKNLLFSL